MVYIQKLMALPATPADLHVCPTCGRPSLATGAIAIDPVGLRVHWQGADLGLTMAEYRVIVLLVSSKNRYVSYRHLYDALRDDPNFIAGYGDHGYKANMRSSIKRIRNKFRAVDPNFIGIVNYTGHGYIWRGQQQEEPQ